MPEGPEVQTVVDTLSKILNGQRVLDFIIPSHKNRVLKSDNFHQIINKKIVHIGRKGKFIDLMFNDKSHLLIHLGMTGYFRTSEKANYIFSIITPHNQLFYFDPRKFGQVIYLLEKEYDTYEPLQKIGIDGMTSSPHEIELILKNKRNKKSKRVIKPYLMDATEIAGIGNIYASEILFLSQIHPERILSSLSDEEIFILSKNIPDILNNAYANGGSTIKSFSNIDGISGSYQNKHYVYQQMICKKCNGAITKIVQSGRSTFYCAKEQK